MTAAQIIRLGPFSVDFRSGEFRKHGVRIKLQRQPLLVLEALLEKPGEVITREDLRQRLWPKGVFVDYDQGMNKAVNRLREVFGDDAAEPRWIETLPLRGYRLLVKPETGTPNQPLPASLPFRSLAVLPLENLTAGETEEYFSDGMTDVLIGELAQISSLRVISRTSIIGYKRAYTKRIADVARELNVDAIIEGTVTHASGKVRITAQLIDAATDHHLWARKYECALSDILTVQTEVARAIAEQVNAVLRPSEKNRLARRRAVNPEAYQAYLQGQYFLHQNIRGIPRSLEWFQRSIEADGSNPDAFAGLAQALIFAGIYEFQPFAQAYTAAREAAVQALSLDSENAAAHNALADIKKGLEWDLPGAEREHRRALELCPSHLLTRLWLAETLSRMERYLDALEESARALSLDPVSAISHNNRAMLLWRARRWDEAIEQAQVALDLDPSHVNALWWQGLAYSGKGDYPRALACLSKGFEASGAPALLASLGYASGVAEDVDQARSILARLEDMARKRNVSASNFAVVHAGLGDADAVFLWFEKAYAARDGRVHQLGMPIFDRFRDDPRYLDLKVRTGLP